MRCDALEHTQLKLFFSQKHNYDKTVASRNQVKVP